jgi:hypothetical protein
MHCKNALAAVVVCLLVPTAAAQLDNPTDSTPTTLYFHIFDTLNKFVINTQPMNAQYFEVGGSNFPTLTGTPVNTAYGVQWDLNTIYGTSTAGPVEYNVNENGKPRFHPERGIAADVIIDENVQPVVKLYVEVRDFVGLTFAPNVLPAYTFEVNMREGDDPGKDAVYDGGAIIMSGKETYHLCGEGFMPGFGNVCSQASLDYPMLVPDESGNIEVLIPLDIAQAKIPKVEAFNIRLDWYQLSEYGATEEDQFASGYMRFNATSDYQPRLEMNIMNPVYVEFLHPQVAAGTLLIHSGVNSPWGTYDVDAANMTVTIDGPSQPQDLKRVVSQNSHVHGLHDQAAEITYLWKFREEGAENGAYSISISVPNVAGTSSASAVGGFTLEGARAFGVDTEGKEVESSGEENSKESPPAGVFVSLLALAFVAINRRKL